jgi:biopolymer transport protein ExbD
MKITMPKEKRALPENTIALINVVFLMLIFFLIVGTVAAPLSKDLQPAWTSQRPLVPPHPQVIEINAAGEISFQGKSIALDRLGSTARQITTANSDENFIKLAADHELEAGRLIEILETLKAAKVDNIRLVTLDRMAKQ